MLSSPKKRLGQRSVFMTVLSLFFFITIPLYILGFGIYQWGYRTIEQEITSALGNYLSDSKETLENEVERIRKLQFSCLNDEDLFYTINAEDIMTPFERSQSLLRMQHRLEVMQESSPFIEDVKACLIRTGRMISVQKGVERLDDSWKNILYAPSDQAESHITYLGNRLYMCASYPIISPDPNATPLYTLIISLNTNSLRERLLSFNRYENGMGGIYHAGSQWLITQGKDQQITDQDIISDEFLIMLQQGKTSHLSIKGQQYLAVSSHSDYLNMTFFSCVAEKDIFSGLWHYRMLFSILFFGMLAVAVGFSIGSYYLIRRPMKRLVTSLKKVEKGDLSIRIKHKMNDEYGYMYDTFNNMAEALQNSIEMNYKQKLLTQQAQMRQLQTQINPHFLYNSFFTLYRMAKDEDYESVTEFLVYLSDYYHYITRDAQQEITLREDIHHAENYAHIQKIRFARRINVVLEEPPEITKQIVVPRLIIQPLLENAFNHGLKDVAEDGLLRVFYRQESGCLCVCVENNGVSISPEELEQLQNKLNDSSDQIEVTGLINIHRRMRLRFGDEAGIRVLPRVEGGVIVELWIPVEEEPHVPDINRG